MVRLLESMRMALLLQPFQENVTYGLGTLPLDVRVADQFNTCCPKNEMLFCKSRTQIGNRHAQLQRLRFKYRCHCSGWPGFGTINAIVVTPFGTRLEGWKALSEDQFDQVRYNVQILKGILQTICLSNTVSANKSE